MCPVMSILMLAEHSASAGPDEAQVRADKREFHSVPVCQALRNS